MRLLLGTAIAFIALLACCICGLTLDGDARHTGVTISLAIVLVIAPLISGSMK